MSICVFLFAYDGNALGQYLQLWWYVGQFVSLTQSCRCHIIDSYGLHRFLCLHIYLHLHFLVHLISDSCWSLDPTTFLLSSPQPLLTSNLRLFSKLYRCRWDVLVEGILNFWITNNYLGLNFFCSFISTALILIIQGGPIAC